MNLTQKYMQLRLKVQTVSSYTDENDPLVLSESDPKWIQDAKSISDSIEQIQKQIKFIEGKQAQKKQQQFQEALNNEILQLRSQLVEKMQKTDIAIKKFDVPTQEIPKDDPEAKMFLKYVAKSLKTQMSVLGQEFKQLQSKFLDGVVAPKQLDTQHLGEDAKRVYGGAEQVISQNKEDVQHICQEISGLVQMIGNLTKQVYECGTILNRIDENLTKAEDYIEEGNKNLEKTKDTQKTVSKLRSVTYILIIANYAMSIAMILVKILKIGKGNNNGGNTNTTNSTNGTVVTSFLDLMDYMK